MSPQITKKPTPGCLYAAVHFDHQDVVEVYLCRHTIRGYNRIKEHGEVLMFLEWVDAEYETTSHVNVAKCLDGDKVVFLAIRDYYRSCFAPIIFLPLTE